jgi:hypothetical protein
LKKEANNKPVEKKEETPQTLPKTPKQNEESPKDINEDKVDNVISVQVSMKKEEEPEGMSKYTKI